MTILLQMRKINDKYFTTVSNDDASFDTNINTTKYQLLQMSRYELFNKFSKCGFLKNK